MTRYYHTELGPTIDVVVAVSPNGSWSKHTSEDRTLKEGVRGDVRQDWKEGRQWEQITRESANELLSPVSMEKFRLYFPADYRPEPGGFREVVARVKESVRNYTKEHGPER